MPPQRTIPLSQKPLKTERTHEENQERYVFNLVCHLYLFSSDIVPTLRPHGEVTEV